MAHVVKARTIIGALIAPAVTALVVPVIVVLTPRYPLTLVRATTVADRTAGALPHAIVGAAIAYAMMLIAGLPAHRWLAGHGKRDPKGYVASGAAAGGGCVVAWALVVSLIDMSLVPVTPLLVIAGTGAVCGAATAAVFWSIAVRGIAVRREFT